MSSLVWDVLAGVGLLLVVAGVALIYWPAALLLGGVVVMGAAVVGARLASEPAEQQADSRVEDRLAAMTDRGWIDSNQDWD